MVAGLFAGRSAAQRRQLGLAGAGRQTAGARGMRVTPMMPAGQNAAAAVLDNATTSRVRDGQIDVENALTQRQATVAGMMNDQARLDLEQQRLDDQANMDQARLGLDQQRMVVDARMGMNKLWQDRAIEGQRLGLDRTKMVADTNLKLADLTQQGQRIDNEKDYQTGMLDARKAQIEASVANANTRAQAATAAGAARNAMAQKNLWLKANPAPDQIKNPTEFENWRLRQAAAFQQMDGVNGGGGAPAGMMRGAAGAPPAGPAGMVRPKLSQLDAQRQVALARKYGMEF